MVCMKYKDFDFYLFMNYVCEGRTNQGLFQYTLRQLLFFPAKVISGDITNLPEELGKHNKTYLENLVGNAPVFYCLGKIDAGKDPQRFSRDFAQILEKEFNSQDL